MPDLLEQLKQKYQPVLDAIQKEGAQLQNVNLDGNQLYIKVTANSEASKNRIWDAIKAVDPYHSDLKHDIEFRQVDQTYGFDGKNFRHSGTVCEHRRVPVPLVAAQGRVIVARPASYKLAHTQRPETRRIVPECPPIRIVIVVPVVALHSH